MSRPSDIIDLIIRGTSDTNIRFEELCRVLEYLGFQERIKGSHHIFTKHGVVDRINIQSESGKAKPYQVKQVRNLIVKYKLWTL